MAISWKHTALTAGAVALLVALLAPASILAQQGRGWAGGHGCEMRRGPMGMALLLGQLDLTDAQRDQVRTVMQEHDAELQALMEKVDAARAAQHAAITATPVNEAEIRAKGADLAAAMTETAVLRARIHEQVSQILTPEQRAKAEELRAQRQKRMGERRERWHQRRQAGPPQQ
jgi:Spy/CpxP family protein refolding chaperone